VRLLGPVDVVDVDGEVVDFARPKAQELLTWLVLHRGAPTRQGARGALWDDEVGDATFANVVSEARRVLHRRRPPDDGPDWVARCHGELLPLRAEVTSDVELFRAALGRADALGGPLAMSWRRRALSLVRGVPFAGSTYRWVDTEALGSTLTMMVVATAVELAEQALEAGDVASAFWATEVGLGVLPGQEELVGVRLRAHAASADRAAMRHEWGAYCRMVAADPWQARPSADLVALYDRLVDRVGHVAGRTGRSSLR
jgi:two-component SAPR family response regulator